MRKLRLSLKNANGATLVFLSCLLTFLPFVPDTVQNGDSGEYCFSALLNTVAHPPGYPLYSWLNSIFVLGANPDRIPFRLGLLSAIFASLALAIGFRARAFQASPWLKVLFVAFALTHAQVFRFATVPEVFSLHILLVVSFVAIVLGPLEVRYRLLLSGLVFGLGASHHHTILFLWPLLLLVVHEFFLETSALKQTQSWLWLTASVLIPIGLSVLLYGSLLLRNTEHLYSWGALEDRHSVLNHFLRTDYGTFRLTSNGGTGLTYDAVFTYWSLWLPAFLISLLLFFASYRDSDEKIKRRLLALFLVSPAYLFVFFGLARIDAASSYIFVKRFFIMPHILACLSCLYSLSKILNLKDFYKFSLIGVLAILILWQALEAKLFLEMVDSKDYSVFARQILKVAEDTKTDVLFAQGDTEQFTLIFESAVQKSATKIATFHSWVQPWYQNRIKSIFLGVKLPTPVTSERPVGGNKPIHVDHEIFSANLGRIKMMSTFPVPNLGLFQQKFHLPGIEVITGIGRTYANFDLGVIKDLDPPPPPEELFHDRKVVRMRYVLPLTTFARDAIAANQPQHAVRPIGAALQLMPESQIVLELACSPHLKGLSDQPLCPDE